jgi:hypothetical protein
MIVEANAPAKPMCSLGLLEKERMKITIPTTLAPPQVACCASGSYLRVACRARAHAHHSIQHDEMS